MRLQIHRGASEIGGNCIQVEASGKSILLDLGAPLSGQPPSPDALPTIPGLTDGTNGDLLGIVISHPHADHYGLLKFAHPSIPVYIGAEADKLLCAAAAFGPFGAVTQNAVHYRRETPFEIGPFRLTPYLNDHSAFDAYSFLVEAQGRSLFYSGDIRGHGWKSRSFERLLETGPKNVDVMLLEGTTVGRSSTERMETEADLVQRLANSIAETDGLVLAMFAGQNIDRLVTFFKGSRIARRGLIVDLYLAHMLRAIGRKSLPDPTGGALRVYLPRRQKLGIVRNQKFDLVEPFRRRRIYPNELHRRRRHLVMTFRSSMTEELEAANCLDGAKLIYSMWPGYLDRSSPDLRDWCENHGMEFEIIHTSGHADITDLARMVHAIRPRRLIPIHTIAPDQYSQFGGNVVVLQDGEWVDV